MAYNPLTPWNPQQPMQPGQPGLGGGTPSPQSAYGQRRRGSGVGWGDGGDPHPRQPATPPKWGLSQQQGAQPQVSTQQPAPAQPAVGSAGQPVPVSFDWSKQNLGTPGGYGRLSQGVPYGGQGGLPGGGWQGGGAAGQAGSFMSQLGRQQEQPQVSTQSGYGGGMPGGDEPNEYRQDQPFRGGQQQYRRNNQQPQGGWQGGGI